MLSRLVLSAASSVALVGVLGVAGGCSSNAGDGASSASTSGALVVLDPALAAVADVETDTVSFPALGSSALESRNAGDLLVSPRAAATSKNPSGFLRTLGQRTDSGGRLTFKTGTARITDLVKEGTADAHLAIPDVSDALHFASQEIFAVDQDMGDFAAELKGIRLEASGNLNSANVSFHPDLEVKTAFSRAKLSELRVVATGDFASDLDVQMNVKVDGTLGEAALNYLQTFRVLSWQKRIYSSPTWALPTQWIGAVPIEESVQMYVNVVCGVRLNAFTGGELDARARGQFKGSIQGGEAYENGAWSSIGSASFSGSAALDLAKGASIDVSCQLAPSFALRFYDIAGPEIGVGPDLHFKVTTTGFGNADSATSWEVDPGVWAWFKGDLEVLGLSKSIGPFTIYNWTGSSLFSGGTGALDGGVPVDAGALGDDGGFDLTGGDDDAGN